jgi:hypothetical protein
LTTETKKEGFANAKPSHKEFIELNKLTTIIATIVVIFFFTRSAPFPSSTYWELTAARDFKPDLSDILFPEILALKISDSSLSLMGLKAIYHIFYFIICSSFCFWIFKNKEPLPGLIALSVFTFSMQVYFNLKLLLTLTFILGILFLLDNNYIKNRFGIIFLPIMGAVSGLGLNTALILSLIFCHVFYRKNIKLSFIIWSIIGGLLFPEGFIASFDKDLIFNWNFIPNYEIKTLFVLSCIFLFVNIISLSKITSRDLPNLTFYVITGLFAFFQPTALPIFVAMGLFLFIKLYSDQHPLPLNYQMVGLFVITTIVYLYLFINPYGIKLNPVVNGQLGKELSSVTEDYVKSMDIEWYNLGELIWKNVIINYNQEKLHNFYHVNSLKIEKSNNNEYKIVDKEKVETNKEQEGSEFSF